MDTMTNEPTMLDAREAARSALGILSDLPGFIEKFQKFWTVLGITEEVPSAHQIAIWHRLHREDLMVLMEALNKTSYKASAMENENKEFTLDHAVRFLSSVANSLKTIKENNMKSVQPESSQITQKPQTKRPLLGYIGERPKETVAVDETTGALLPTQEVSRG